MATLKKRGRSKRVFKNPQKKGPNKGLPKFRRPILIRAFNLIFIYLTPEGLFSKETQGQPNFNFVIKREGKDRKRLNFGPKGFTRRAFLRKES